MRSVDEPALVAVAAVGLELDGAGGDAVGVERRPAAAEVGPGAEAPARAGDDDGPHVGVGVDAVEGVDSSRMHAWR